MSDLINSDFGSTNTFSFPHDGNKPENKPALVYHLHAATERLAVIG